MLTEVAYKEIYQLIGEFIKLDNPEFNTDSLLAPGGFQVPKEDQFPRSTQGNVYIPKYSFSRLLVSHELGHSSMCGRLVTTLNDKKVILPGAHIALPPYDDHPFQHEYLAYISEPHELDVRVRSTMMDLREIWNPEARLANQEDIEKLREHRNDWTLSSDNLIDVKNIKK